MNKLRWDVVMAIAEQTECRMDISVADAISQTVYTRRGRWYEDDMVELEAKIDALPSSSVEWVRFDSGLGILEAGVVIRYEKRSEVCDD